jgi:amino acid transporter
MAILDLLFGRPLATSEDRAEQVGSVTGVPIFGLDALSSAAYGPEAALTLLIPLGAAGVAYILPISASIIVLLGIVYFSYRQTIAAYPGGGGSYTVASENLGVHAGLLAAAALMIDYILTVAVGISAGVGALVSAVPSLLPHTVGLCLLILVFITFINLRGLRQTGIVFMVPTYLFLATLLATIVFGVFKSVVAGGHPVPVAVPPPAVPAVAAVSVWLILQSFASGCTAMTGVEAVSNGVRAFREPAVNTARRALTIIIALLMVLLAGIAYLIRAYHVAATDPGQSGYQSVISILVAAVAGRGVFYFVTIGAVLVVLALSANTAFADFPRLCRAIALDGFLPYSFSIRGRRLVYSEGVYFLALLAGALLVLFRGVTNRLIPLYAFGAFLAFTLSQAGMVAHWRRVRGRGAGRSIFVNGLGAVATGITVLIILVAKFVEGAWITVLLIPALLALMVVVRRHFDSVSRQLECTTSPLDVAHSQPPLVVVPVEAWGQPVMHALLFAMAISPEIQAVHVGLEDEKEDINAKWNQFVAAPARQSGLPPPKLTILTSPYRMVVTPIVDHILELAAANPQRKIAVVVPQLVESRWYFRLLAGNRAELLKGLLLLKGNPQVTIITVPWYLSS